MDFEISDQVLERYDDKWRTDTPEDEALNDQDELESELESDTDMQEEESKIESQQNGNTSHSTEQNRQSNNDDNNGRVQSEGHSSPVTIEDYRNLTSLMGRILFSTPNKDTNLVSPVIQRQITESISPVQNVAANREQNQDSSGDAVPDRLHNTATNRDKSPDLPTDTISNTSHNTSVSRERSLDLALDTAQKRSSEKRSLTKALQKKPEVLLDQDIIDEEDDEESKKEDKSQDENREEGEWLDDEESMEDEKEDVRFENILVKKDGSRKRVSQGNSTGIKKVYIARQSQKKD